MYPKYMKIKSGTIQAGSKMKVWSVSGASGAELGFRTSRNGRLGSNVSVWGATCVIFGFILGARWILKWVQESFFGLSCFFLIKGGPVAIPCKT